MSNDYTLEDRVYGCMAIVVMVILIVVAWGSAAYVTAKRYQIEAVKRNAAEWVVDQNGDVKFQWNEQAD